MLDKKLEVFLKPRDALIENMNEKEGKITYTGKSLSNS